MAKPLQRHRGKARRPRTRRGHRQRRRPADHQHPQADPRAQAAPRRKRLSHASPPPGSAAPQMTLSATRWCGAASPGHLHRHHVAGPGRSAPAPQVDEAVVRGPAGQPLGGAVLAALALGDQHLEGRGRPAACSPSQDDLLLERRPAARSAPGRPPSAPGRPWWPRGVPGRLEYWKVKALREPGLRGPRRAWPAKSSSVSPGKPTMMSVVMAASGMAARTFVDDAEVALRAGSERRIAFRHRSEPDCSGMCSCGHHVGRLGHRRDHVVGEVARVRAR